MTKSNIVEVSCWHFWSDWTATEAVKIDLDKYNSFKIDYRCDSWHIIGRFQVNDNWRDQELSEHQVCGIRELAKFITNVNKCYKSYEKVTTYNNYHGSKDFTRRLKKLFDLVEELNPSEQEDK